jgi:SAM-dependent methyltransferase
MPELFATASMAEGYARARPPIHPFVLERVRRRLGRRDRLPRALEVGGGAGLSPRPLGGRPRRRVGLDPARAMVRWGRSVAPGASFLVGSAEVLPLRSRSMDLVTAAGSLNWVDLDRFLPEAARVLVPRGLLVVYDFFQGSSFRDSPALGRWFAAFSARYPRPPDGGREIGPAVLSSAGGPFRLEDHEDFEIDVSFTLESYLGYVMSEVNVSAAVGGGAGEDEIRSWCRTTLAPVFGEGAREVVFGGYVAYLTASGETA